MRRSPSSTPPRSLSSSEQGHFQRRDAGLTLIEILIATGLLLILTTALFQLIVPTIRRTEKLGWQQDNIQKFILFKEYMTKRLGNATVLANYVQSDAVEFYLPCQVDTSEYGRLNMLNVAETTYWNETQRCRLYLAKDSRNNNVITETIEGTDRALWNLCNEGTVSFYLYTTPPILDITILVKDTSHGGENPQKLPFEKSMQIQLPRVK